MLAILAASVIAVAAPAALVFYFFTRDAAIEEAEQFAATSADRRVLGLNYTLRLASTSLARFDLMLHDRLSFGGTEEEVSRFRSVLERNDAGMLVSRRKDFNGRTQAGVLFHPGAPNHGRGLPAPRPDPAPDVDLCRRGRSAAGFDVAADA